MSIIERTYYRIEDEKDPRDGTHLRSRCAAEDADLVSSECEDGRHAPVFDIDMPATLQHVAHGSSVLRVQGSGSSLHLLTFIEVAIRGGLLHDSSRDAYSAQPDRRRNRMAFPELQLSVPAALLPSHSQGHFHLLLDASLEWHAYERLLELAQQSGLIAMEYLILCRKWKKGFLWMPDKKPAFMRDAERSAVSAEARCREIADSFPYGDPYAGW